MFPNMLIAEGIRLQMATPVQDYGAAANDGAWVSLKHYPLAEVVLLTAVGTAGQDPTITLQQAQDVSGTGAKALTFTRIYSQQGANIEAVGVDTLVEQVAANTYTDGTAAENETVWRIPIRAQDLDVEGGFDCIRATVADTGAAAQLGAMFYLLMGRYSGHQMPSPLSN